MVAISRPMFFLNEEPVPILLGNYKKTHVALLSRLLFYVYAIAGKLYGWDDKHCFLMLNICQYRLKSLDLIAFFPRRTNKLVFASEFPCKS